MKNRKNTRVAESLDVAAKNLESYPDVASDMANVLLYDGTPEVDEKNLQAAPTETTYPGRDRLHSQLEDVEKYEMLEGKLNAIYQIANQSTVDNGMLLRKASYVGATYREQYDGKITSRCPIIGMVLYWGTGRWSSTRSIRRMFRKNQIPDKAWQYIDDFRLHVFEMRYLPPEVRQRFTSDMRIIVEYLADKENLETLNHPIKHLDAVLRMLQALSHDDRYLDILKLVEKEEEDNKEGNKSMCELLDKYWNGGVAQGIVQGIAQGELKGKSEAIIELLEELGILSSGLRNRITEEKNLAVLSQWVKWAARAGSIDEFEARLS